MADYAQFKKAMEEWARPDRRAMLIIEQDGEAHARVTVVPAGKSAGAASQTVRIGLTQANALDDAQEQIRGIIDDISA
jgi:hypothetical protein